MPVHPGAASGILAVAARKSILLFDDDVDLCALLKTVLQWNNYSATTVHQGVDGIKEIIQRDFDVILCNTGLSGNAFYRAVNRIRPHLAPRFVFLCSQTDCASDLPTSLGLPTIFKPLCTDELLSQIALVTAKAKTVLPHSNGIRLDSPLRLQRDSASSYS